MNRKQKNILAFVVLIIVVAALFYAFRSNLYEQNISSTKQKKDQLILDTRLTWLHQSQFAGFYVAADKAFYKDLGLDVKLLPGGLEYPSIKMVSTGNDKIGVTSADQILLARSKGAPVVAIAVLYQKSPVVMFSLKKYGIKKPEDLKGKKIGIKYGDNTEVPIRALLRKKGIIDKITEVSVSYNLAPLIKGKVVTLPGFAINEPQSLVEKGYDINQIYPADYGINIYADVIFTTKNMLSNHRTELVKFLQATFEGFRFAINHPEEAVDLTMKRNANLDREHQLNMLKASIPLWQPKGKRIGEMNKENWMQINEILVRQGLIDKKVDIDEAVNFSLIKEAYNQ